MDAVSLLPLVVAVAATVAALSVLPRVLRRSGILDEPGSRSSHVVATPRGAGLAVGPAALLGVVAGGGSVLRPALPLLAAGTAALLLGLADDVRSLRAFTRLLAQVLLGAGALAALAADGEPLAPAVALLALAWIVAFTNAFNFMDGINGISAATVIVTGVCWTALGSSQHDALLGTVGAVLAVSCLAFLPWNVPRAAIFLGDSGSYFLGTTLAVLVVLAAERGAPLVALIAPLAIYLTDTGTTLVRRSLRGERLLEAHREHVYQQLASIFGHVPTSLLVAGASAMTGCLGLLASRNDGFIGNAYAGGGLAVCACYAALPRLLRARFM